KDRIFDIPFFTALMAFCKPWAIPFASDSRRAFPALRNRPAYPLIVFHALLIPWLMVFLMEFQTLLVTLLMEFQMFVTVLLIPFATLETTDLMPFQTFEKKDLIPSQMLVVT